MTPQKLADLREQTEQSLRTKLIINKIASRRGLTDLAYYDRRLINIVEATRAITINEDETNVAGKIAKLSRLYQHSKGIGLSIKMIGITKPIGRSDYFDHISFRIRWYTVREFVPESLISELTKKALVNIVKPKDWSQKNGYKSFLLDCSLMTLFKAGEMNMARVIELSNADCVL